MRSTNRYLRAACPLLLFCFISLSSFAQGLSVSGTVKDAAGEPLIGARVGIEGSTSGAVTGLEGEFAVQVDRGARLVVSYLGYTTQTIDVAGRSRIDVVMQIDSETLEDVVVIGYGTQRREAVTGSVASMRGDAVREVPAGNITQAMAGRIAGVQMTQNSSRPGAAMEVRIRGARSLTASNDPLVVLDGIPFAGTLADVDPASIKGIDILKDASATAIYGSRGANGVIMVTTKTGARGAGTTPAKLTYNGYYGIKNAIRVDMMDGKQFADLKNYLKTAPSQTGLFSNLGANEREGVNTDWQDMFYRQGYVTSHDVGVAGGSSVASYSLGANYYRDQAVVPTQNYTRYSLRANLDMQVAKWFRVGLMSNTNYNVTEGQQLGVGAVLDCSTIADPYNEDGSLRRTVAGASDTWWTYTKETIEANRDNWRNDTRTLGTFNTVFAEVSAPWVEGLKYRVNLGLNYTQNHNGQYTGEGINSTNAIEPSTGVIDNRFTTNWAVENLLTFDRTFNGKHNLNVTALYSAEQTQYSRAGMRARDIPWDQFQYWNLGHAEGTVSILPGDQDYWKRGLLSWMGRVMYSYENKYMISASIRSDGASVLAPGHQWHTYPAVSVGWNIANEAFMQDASWVDELKLRVGYGETSNQSINPNTWEGRLGTRPYNFGGNYATGYYVENLANSMLGWEYTNNWNFGLDFGLFNNRLTGTIEYYRQKTHGVLQNVNLPYTSGVTSYTANIGKTQNRGFEFSLNGTIFDDPDGWSWDAGINLYLNRNKLTELASGATRDEGNMWFVGYPINSIYDYEYDGLWQQGDEHMTKYGSNLTPGSIKVKYNGDYNEDGSPTRAISAADRQIMSMEPAFQGGFNTRVAYRNLDLSVLATFQKGGLLISTLYQGNGYLNMMNGRRGQVDVDYWTPENTDAKWPNPYGTRSGDNPQYLNSLGYFDGSYLKISTISLGYNLPAKWMDSAGIDNIRLYFTAQNPFVLFSPYHKQSGLDPEPNARGNDASFTASNASSVPQRFLVVGTNTPNTRNYIFGLNITF